MGTWDLALTNWFSGGSDVIWPNTATAEAIFGGTGGLVTINTGTGITANKLTFGVNNYTIASNVAADILTLAGTTPTVSVLTGTATISSNISSAAGLTKTGVGALSLTGANTITGPINVTAGALSGLVKTGPGALNSFGGSPIILSAGSTLDITATANTSLAGLSGRVFNTGVTLGDTSRIDFTQTATGNGALAATRVDTALNNTGNVAGGSNTNLGIQWLGKLSITSAGSYQFGTNSDDGSRVYIDGVLVLNNDGPKGVGTVNTSQSITLSAGLHDIRIDYVNGTGSAGLSVGYSGPDQAVFGAIPSAALFQAESNTAAGSSNAVTVGSALTATGVGTSTVNLNGNAFTQVQFGSLDIHTGSTLAVTGLDGKTLRVSGASTLGNGAGNITINTAGPNVALDGVVSDGGNAMTINKTGTGRLIFDQTAAPNTLGATTNLNVQSGSLVLVGSTAAGANNPIGSASINLSGVGAGLVIDSKGATSAGVGNTYANNITVSGTGTTIQSVVNAATTTWSGGIAVNGGSNVTFDAIAGGQPATDPGATLLISGPLTGTGTVNIASTRLGNFPTSLSGAVNFTNTTGFTGTLGVLSGGVANGHQFATLAGINLAAGGTLNYLFDGNGSGTPGSSPIASQNTASQNVAFDDDITVSGVGTATIVVNRLGTTFTPLYTQAVNKTAKLGSLTIGAQSLVISNPNGYGADFAGTTTISGSPSFTVTNTTVSTAVPGLTLSGKVTGTGGFTKAGSGTMLLTNATNDFNGDVNITAGVLAISSNAALGAVGNQLILNAAGATLRATQDVNTGRVIQINSATNSIFEVADGKSLTITSAFGGPATGGWTKQDLGTLVLSAPNTHSGALTINAGATRVKNNAALGTGVVSISPGAANPGAALQLDNVSIANIINLQGTNNLFFGGINFGGQLQSVAGTNTTTGQLQLNFDASIGADAGSVLNINGGIHNPTTTGRAFGFTGAGTINVNSDITAATATANQYFGMRKFGSGTLNFTVPVSIVPTDTASGLQFFGGTTNLSGNATMTGGVGVPLQIQPGATFAVTDSGTPITSRLGARQISVNGGTFSYTGNSANSTDTFGTLATTFGSTIVSNQTGAGTVTLNFSSANFAGGSNSIVFSGTNLGTATNRILFSTAPTTVPATSGILARAIITSGGGFDFVSYNHNGTAANTNGIQAFAAYNTANNIDTAAATDTLNISANPTFSANKTINALKITGNGISIASTGLSNTTLTLTAGGIAVTGGTNTISVPVLATAGVEQFYHVNAGATLNLNSTLSGTGGFTKADNGTLVLTGPAGAIPGVTASQMSGTFAVNGGTLKLGSDNAYLPNDFLRIGPGGTYDLNGHVQAVRSLLTDSVVPQTSPGAFGTITNSTGTGNLATNFTEDRSWAGQMTGAMNFMRSGGNNLLIHSDNTYTGKTTFNGGTTSIRNDGRLSGTTEVNVNYATLTLENNANSTLSDKINNAADIKFRGANFSTTGRANTALAETLGKLVLERGNSSINVGAGSGTTWSSELIFSSLQQNNGAVLNIQVANGQIGNASRILFTTAPTLTNNIIPYIHASGSNPATYIPGLGLAALNAPGAPGFDATAFPATGLATQNLQLNNGTFSVPDAASGTYLTNSLTLPVNTGGQSLNFTDGTDVLNVTSGLILRNGAFTGNYGATIDSGRITAGGTANSGTRDLYLVQNSAGTLTLNSRVIDNPNGAAVRLNWTPYNGASLIIANGSNSYTGGTIFNGGAVTGSVTLASTGRIPAGGLTIHQVNFTQQAGGVIDAANDIVTISGNSAVTLTGNNSFKGLVFDNFGGNATTLTATPFGVPGILTIGSSGILVSSSNVTSTPSIPGRVQFGSTTTFNIEPIMMEGKVVNPLQSSFNIQGITGTAGIDKVGDGVLGLTAQQVYTGPTHVIAGGLNASFGTAAITGPASGSRFSAYTFETGTRLNLTNDAVIGSLAGGGVVTNSSTAGRTFGVGFDNTSTTFSGQFARFNEAITNPYALIKLGTGTMTLTGVSTNTNTLTIQGGGITLQGTGRTQFATNTVNTTGTLTLDNRVAAGGNQNNRLTGPLNAGTLSLGGGTLAIIGNSTAATPTTETIGTLTFASGPTTVTLDADPANPLTLTVGATFSGVQTGGSALLRGDNFGSAPGNGVSTISIGTANFNPVAGAGTGANGTTTMPIRPDLIGGTTTTSLGTGFITKDSAGNYLRLLDVSETLNAFNTATPAATNVAISTNNALLGVATSGVNVAYSLVLNNGGGVSISSPAAMGNYAANAGLIQTKIGSGGFLALEGNTGITSGQIDTSNNTAFYFHTPGATTTLELTGYLGTTNGGLVKSQAGSVTINSPAYYTGTTTVNAGTLAINTGVDNTIQVVPTTGTPTVSALTVNSGTFELNGTSQTIGTISSSNLYSGGSIRNSAGGAAKTLTSITGAATYGGSIDGNLNFVKSGNSELILTSPSTYTGTTAIHGNILRLRDGGSLASTSYDIHYGQLILDNGALTPLANPARIPASSTINLRGGQVQLIGGGSLDTTANIASVSAVEGHSTFNLPASTAGGATFSISIGDLVRTNPDATVNFVGASTGFFSNAPTYNSGHLYISSINGTPIPATITNKILGGWAVVNNGEFATYVQPTTPSANGINYGLVTMNGIGAIPQTQYDSNLATLPASNSISNVRLSGTGSIALPAGNVSYNVLAVRAAATGITFTNATDTLNLTSGGLALTNGGTTVGTLTNGRLTAGGTQSTGVAPLYIFSNGSSNTIAASIVDNGSGAATRLVATVSANSLILTNANTYTGGTVVNGNGGTLNLNAATPLVVIPAGGLTLNNALVTMTTTAAQIAASNVVTLNGGSSLTMFGSNTLEKLIFNNTGGFAAGNPTVATATSLILNAVDAITSTNDNAGSTPTISGTALVLSNAAPVISVSGEAVTDLHISAPIISGGPITKTGNGTLALSAANTFADGFNLAAGTLIFGVGTVGTGPITSGPVGTGTLTIGNNTTVHSTNNFTVSNPTSVEGNFTFGGTTTIGTNHNLLLSGAMTLSDGPHMITVSSPFVTGTISGLISGGTNLIKAGLGNLVLTNSENAYGGSTTITGGVLRLGTNNVIPNASAVTVHSGAVLDLNNFDETVGSIAGGGLTTNSGGTAKTLNFGGNHTNTIYSGTFSNAVGALNIQKTGQGTMILTGTSSHTGTTVIQGSGALSIANANALGSTSAGTTISGAVTNSGRLELSGGITFAAEPLTLEARQGANVNAVHVANVSGNNTWTGPITLAAGGGGYRIESNADTLTISGNITQTNIGSRVLTVGGAGNGTLSGNYISSGASDTGTVLVKDGAGTWTLAGSNSYLGTTTVSAGTLLVNGSLSGSTTTVNAAGTLGGNGVITGLNVNGGTLSPGNSPGILNAGNTAFNNGTFALDLFGDTAGNGANNYDQLNVTGTVSLTGDIALTISLGSFNPLDDGSMKFVILNNDSTDLITGTGLFSYQGNPLAEGAGFVVGSQIFNISYVGGVDNNDVILTAIPEPGSAVTLLAGLGSLLAIKRRRRQS